MGIYSLLLLIEVYLQYNEVIKFNNLLLDTNYVNLRDFGIMMILTLSSHMLSSNYKYFILSNKLNEKSKHYFMDFLIKSDAEWLSQQGKFQRTIQDASETVSSIIIELFDLISPLLHTITQLYALSLFLGYQVIMVSLLIGIIFMTGMIINYYDFHQQKYLRKETKKYGEYADSLFDNFFIRKLNGTAQRTSDEIVENLMEHSRRQMYHHRKIRFFQNSLELLNCIFLIWCCLDYLENENFAFVYNTLYQLFWKGWWIFSSTTSLLKTLSGWALMEDFLSTYQLDKINKKSFLPKEVVCQCFKDDTILEVHLIAESGGGKTSWMKQKLLFLYTHYQSGQWLYLDQQMRLPNSPRTKRELMSDFYPVRESMDISLLLELSLKIGIAHLFENLDLPFKEPSGGETKRILILRSLLPLIQGCSKVKYLFNDEVLVGLDEVNYLKVRPIFERLKENGIRIITIDHHPFDGKGIIKVPVKFKKQEILIKENKITESKTFLTWLLKLFFNEKEKETSQTKILAWLDKIEPEPKLESESIQISITS
jgi:ABC-type multidrug transport system ATPase subunit